MSGARKIALRAQQRVAQVQHTSTQHTTFCNTSAQHQSNNYSASRVERSSPADDARLCGLCIRMGWWRGLGALQHAIIYLRPCRRRPDNLSATKCGTGFALMGGQKWCCTQQPNCCPYYAHAHCRTQSTHTEAHMHTHNKDVRTTQTVTASATIKQSLGVSILCTQRGRRAALCTLVALKPEYIRVCKRRVILGRAAKSRGLRVSLPPL